MHMATRDTCIWLQEARAYGYKRHVRVRLAVANSVACMATTHQNHAALARWGQCSSGVVRVRVRVRAIGCMHVHAAHHACYVPLPSPMAVLQAAGHTQAPGVRTHDVP